jgi:uncharacterized protein (DUF302 family)
MAAEFTAYAHSMTRVDVSTGVPFDEFRAAFEKAAPPVDIEATYQVITQGGNWDDVRAVADANAPNGLMVYWTIDATPLMAAAGHRTKAVEYLLGNHVIAESMFRYNPRTLLYAPLRVLLYADADDNAVFSMDRPRTAFGSLGVDAITAVGEDLDRKVAALLRVIGVDADAAFAAG